MKLTNTARALACTLVALPALVFATQEAEAGGYAVREMSTSSLGNAHASAPTGIDDPSYMFWNPAMLTYLPGIQATTSGAYIIPNAEFKPGSARTADTTSPPFPVAVTGTAISPSPGFEGNEDIGRDALVSALYGMWSFDEDLKLGLSISVPFGLFTDNRAGWIGRYHALKSELVTIDMNPVVAYRVTDYLSVGGGFRAVYADAELSQAVDVGTLGDTLGASVGAAGTADGRARLKGDDWGFGGNIGIMFEPGKIYEPLKNVRVGVGYRSRVDLEIKGDVKFDLSGAGALGPIVQGAGFFLNTDATAAVDLPETVNFGVNYDLNDQWSFMGQVEWTNWSEFEELVVEVDQGAQGNSITEEDWNDGWFYALGATYRPDWLENSALRFGAAYELTPVPDRTRTPRIPDNDRVWLALGFNYTPLPWLTLDLGYTHIFIKDADINLVAAPNDLRGDLSGKYEAHVDIIALQGTIKF